MTFPTISLLSFTRGGVIFVKNIWFFIETLILKDLFVVWRWKPSAETPAAQPSPPRLCSYLLSLFTAKFAVLPDIFRLSKYFDYVQGRGRVDSTANILVENCL